MTKESDIDPGRLARLPSWARAHIESLQRERDTAVRELQEWHDSQAQSQFYIDELVCVGEGRGPSSMRRYVQTHKITCEAAGLVVTMRANADGVEIAATQENRVTGDIAFIPTCFGQLTIKAKDKMRS